MSLDQVFNLREICANCGFTRGSHCGTSYYSNHYKMYIPLDYCPGHAGRMDWNEGPGTVFSPTGTFEKES